MRTSKLFIQKISCFLIPLVLMIFPSCQSMKKSAGFDEMYDNPTEVRRRQLLALQQAEEEKRKAREEWYAQKEKEMADDPRYQERDFSMDDYYDYEYASRVKRFQSYNPGLGYYDDWYTNQWYYNPGPWAFNNSIYDPYGMYWSPWGYPASSFYGSPWTGNNIGICYSMTWGNPYGYPGMGWGNPMGAWNGFYPYYGWGYNPWMGFGYPWYMVPNIPYETVSYGPRGTSLGSNSPVRSHAGMSRSEALKNIEAGRTGAENQQTSSSPKFQSFEPYKTIQVVPGPRSSKNGVDLTGFSGASSPDISANNEPLVPSNGIRSIFFRDINETSPSQPVRPSGINGNQVNLPVNESEAIKPSRNSAPVLKNESSPSFQKSGNRNSGIQITPSVPSQGGSSPRGGSGGFRSPR